MRQYIHVYEKGFKDRKLDIPSIENRAAFCRRRMMPLSSSLSWQPVKQLFVCLQSFLRIQFIQERKQQENIQKHST